MNDLTLYILIRTDLQSMSPGRAMAQASHASNAFIHTWGERKDTKIWQKQTTQGFGTAIVLGATIDQIETIFDQLSEVKLKGPGIFAPRSKVVDPEYGIKTTIELYQLMSGECIDVDKTITNPIDGSAIVFTSKVTCAYIFGSKEVLSPFLSELSLHP
jgi:peptidyl-tRNA hydrolase